MSEEDSFANKKRKLDSQFAKSSIATSIDQTPTIDYLFHKDIPSYIELPDPIISLIPESQIFNELVGLERSIDILLDEKKKHIKHFLTRTNCQLIPKKLKILISYTLDLDKNEIKLQISGDSLKDSSEHPKRFTNFIKKLFVDFDESVFSNPEDLVFSNQNDNKGVDSSKTVLRSPTTTGNLSAKQVVSVEWDHYTACNDSDGFTTTKKFDLKKKQQILRKIQENVQSQTSDKSTQPQKLSEKPDEIPKKKSFNFDTMDENFVLEEEDASDVKKARISIFLDIFHEPELFCVSKVLEKVIREAMPPNSFNLTNEPFQNPNFLHSDKPLMLSFRQILDYFWKYCIAKKRVDFDNFTILNDDLLKDVISNGILNDQPSFQIQNIVDKLKEHIFFPPPIEIELPVIFNEENNKKIEVEVDVFVSKSEKLELNVLSGWDDFFKTNKIDFKEIKSLNDSIKKAVKDISQRKSKRDFFQRFAQNPVKFMYEYICSNTADLKEVSSVRNAGSLPGENNTITNAGFWTRPWVHDAVSTFFNEKLTGTNLSLNEGHKDSKGEKKSNPLGGGLDANLNASSMNDDDDDDNNSNLGTNPV